MKHKTSDLFEKALIACLTTQEVGVRKQTLTPKE